MGTTTTAERADVLGRSRLAPLRRLSRRGHAGGAILPHRSMWRLALPWHRLATGAALAAGFTALLMLLRPWLAAAWGRALAGWLAALGWPGAAAAVPPWPPLALGLPAADALLDLPLPLLALPLPAPGWAAALAHATVVVGLWLLSSRLSDAARPGLYLLRALALVHGASVLFFSLLPQGFPHTAAGHLAGGLEQVWVLMLLLPWLHLGTYYVFPFHLGQRLALTGLSLAWLALLAPLLYAAHGALLLALGPVVMPALQLLLGVVVPILGLVALYGWGMGWHHPAIAQPPGSDDPARRPESAPAQRP